MDSDSTFLSTMQDALHNMSDMLLYPVLVLLLLGILVTIFEAATLLVEYVAERRFFKVKVPCMLHELIELPAEQMSDAIARSGLLKPQQKVLATIFDNRDLPQETRWALAKKLLIAERDRVQRRYSLDDFLAKVAPMFGLMGTLIPLGPGLVAFGDGDSSAMSSAMLVAFSTTVAGLAIAIVLMTIARIRRKWYGQYSSTLEAAVTSMLERLDAQSPSDAKPEAAPTPGKGDELAASAASYADARSAAEGAL